MNNILNYPKAPCTLKQRQFIRSLYDDLHQLYPDFSVINREEAHRIISNLLHAMSL
jgi:hypothetical protein